MVDVQNVQAALLSDFSSQGNSETTGFDISFNLTMT